jgi:FtsP/CotA-like multicopper oxidase with cupredoxin domain
MTLVNELGPETGASHHHNTIHSPNTTNIHTHGLHIDPNVDTVFVKAGPEESLTYKYHLPADHAPGLHWYHAHHHGSSALQLMGGLVGAMIVEPDVGSAQNIPASLTNADSTVLVISKLMLGQETADGEVTQGCGLGWTCDADSQGPLCTGRYMVQIALS